MGECQGNAWFWEMWGKPECDRVGTCRPLLTKTSCRFFLVCIRQQELYVVRFATQTFSSTFPWALTTTGAGSPLSTGTANSESSLGGRTL